MEQAVHAYVLAWEDSYLPLALPFDAPMSEHGWSAPFEYHWQLLTQAFSLPDPAAFPTGEFGDHEAAELRRFVTVCRELAGCAVLRHHGDMVVDAVSGAVNYEPITAPRASFAVLATRLRQLHCTQPDTPGFDSVAAILTRKTTDTEQIAVLEQWQRARAALRDRPLKNIVARSVLRRQHRTESEANYEGVRADAILAAFDWGHRIAVGGAVTDREEHLFMVSALGLCHLYFGYAVLVQAALGD